MRSWWWGFSCRLSPAAEQKVGGWFHTSPSLLPNSRPPRVLLPGFLVLHPGFANGNNLHQREKSSSKLNASLVSFLGWVSNHFLLSLSCWLFSCSLQRIPCVCIIFPSTAEQWKSNSNPKTQTQPQNTSWRLLLTKAFPQGKMRKYREAPGGTSPVSLRPRI